MSDMKNHKGQMRKFGWYGLLKNLKWFEPYLLLFLLAQQISFFQVGILFAVRETIIYLFEIPSGVIADRYGKKKELLVSFGFYILSFVFFFIARSFYMLLLPMVLFGLGEAFRSGTHKAMIMDYLDVHQITDSKQKVYGYTRSYSNIGSVVSSLFGIGLVLILPDLRVLFLVAVIPYVVDGILIWSYPSYLDRASNEPFLFRVIWTDVWSTIRYVFAERRLRRTLLDSSIFTGMFKVMRDFLQPLLFSAGLGIVLFAFVDAESNARVLVGLAYALAQFISVFVTKYAHKLQPIAPSHVVLFVTWILAAGAAFISGWTTGGLLVAVLGLMGFYIAQNIRKPYLVEQIGNRADPRLRSSILSIESQLSSVSIVILAPIFGWIADQYALTTMFVVAAVIFAGFGLMFTKKDA